MDELEPNVISLQDVKEYLFTELIAEGYAPAEEEIQILAEIFFDFLIEIGAMIEM